MGHKKSKVGIIEPVKDGNKEKAIDLALGQIESQFGKGLLCVQENVNQCRY